MTICKHNEHCGGCIYQEIPYQEQIILKGKEVQRILDEKEIKYEKYLGIEGSPKQLAYRNKMEYTFGDEVKDGEMTLGMHKKGRFMSIITVDECQLVDEDFNKILRAALDFCNEKGYPFYHKKSHEGLLRNLIVRKGEHTKEILVNIVTSSQIEFAEKEFAEMMRGLNLSNKLVGVLHTINDKLADFVYCEKLITVWGQDFYSEEIMGLKFKVSAFSFFQTNILAVEKLYTEALSLIKDLDGKTVFDLYCGTGTITQTLALRAKKAIGVEIVEEAVEAAKENAKLNGLDNCEFIAGDVFEVLDNLEDKPDVIVLDPPRVGIHQKAMKKIVNYGVEQIVYISCNPKSLADNLDFMQSYGYTIKSVKAFDNFPYTRHTECVCLLELLT
ncbi:23S rRNA (uracil(1939)-C(5))-methyltransferase RlmD [Anaerovorax odorimutans]|uniref:23S rRNA (uracil(1939)-C(5))-methyltransferase RlmD n=1 Tax=Anaerovorax odorimutans TaxID=109327 RepID=UPI0004159710|nr:23S rRNA (uracil(1939)-C(5))-methyltransferase RlmD [Anaerovorax odorimutans]